MQKHVNLVDLVKSFPTNIYLQNLASIQKRTSPVKFAHLAEKSGKGSISNLSTKVGALPHHSHQRVLVGACVNLPLMGDSLPDNVRRTPLALAQEGVKRAVIMNQGWLVGVVVSANLERLVLGCIEATFCK